MWAGMWKESLRKRKGNYETERYGNMRERKENGEFEKDCVRSLCSLVGWSWCVCVCLVDYSVRWLGEGRNGLDPILLTSKR